MKRSIQNIFKSVFILMLIFSFYIVICPGESMPAQKTEAAPEGMRALNKGEIIAKAALLAVPFVENAGQFAAEVKFTADLFAGRFFLTGNELVYMMSQPEPKNGTQSDRRGKNIKHDADTTNKSLIFREFFIDPKGGKISFAPAGEEKAETKISYFKGSDSAKWRVNIASYQGVSLGEVYPGVQVKLKASGKNVEKIFYVSPGSDVARIRIGVAGVAGLKIAGDGQLMFLNPMSELAMRAPIAWQEIAGKRRAVQVGYRLLGKQLYGFTVLGKYDKKYPLIIDPELDTLMASTFLGGSKDDSGISLALDNAGNVYVTGATKSADFPNTVGSYDRTYDGTGPYDDDIFVAKLNGDLTKLLASTFLGGSKYDIGTSLDIDGLGNVYLTGWTRSNNFPTTSGAHDRTYAGGEYVGEDVFISKLSGGLTELLASTYLGGSGSDRGKALVLDSSGNVCLTGSTDSRNFPTSPAAFDRSHNGLDDIFISMLDKQLTKLLASTFLGGHSPDHSSSLALDDSGNVYLTGITQSENFPTTAGAYKGWCSDDVFVSKLNGDLSILLASTGLGGSDYDYGSSITLDHSGNVYIAGTTRSCDFPTTNGAYCRENGGPVFGSDVYCTPDIFISKFDGYLTSLLASTYLGGSGGESAYSIILDNMGNVYLAGATGSRNFPVTPGAYDKINNGGNGFVSKLDNCLSSLLSSTFLGGGGTTGSSLVLDGLNDVYLAGFTNDKNFPTTPGAFDRSKNGNSGVDVFVSKFKGSFVKLDLSAERLEVRAFTMVRQYGQILCTVDTLGIPVAEYRLYHRVGDIDFSLAGTVTAQDLQDNQFQMQDKYLEKDKSYTYVVEAYNAAGQLVGRSAEKTI